MIIAAILMAAAPAAPSFDCARTRTRVEIAICKDEELAAADALMGKLFAESRVSAFGSGPSGQVAAQRQWLKDRDSCAAGPTDAQCLRASYDDRNEALAVAALFANPELALDVLRKLDPAYAPLAEAILIFAGEPADTDWTSPVRTEKRSKLLALLGPFVREFANDDRMIYGREILADDRIVTAEDALKTEKSFARFIQITSAYLGEGPVPRSMPCAAIVRRPALLAASDPAFGSTLDNFVMYPDCDKTLPPLPALDALDLRINAGWPECEGTIRYAAYRSYGSTINRARIATAADLGPKASALPIHKGVSKAQVDAAIRELGAYYVRYGRAPKSTAPKLARQMVTGIMAAGRVCY